MECHNLGMQPFAPLIARKLASLPADAPWRSDEAFVERLGHFAVASDFALATLAAQPELLERLRADGAPRRSRRRNWPPTTAANGRACCAVTGRRNRPGWCGATSSPAIGRSHPRRQHAAGGNLPAARARPRWKASSPNATASSAFDFGLRLRSGRTGRRNKTGRVRAGQARRRQLNFSSDIGPGLRLLARWRAMAAPARGRDYFSRLGQRLAKLLDEVTAGRLQPSRRPAPAPLRQRRPRRVVVRGAGTVLPARGPRLGTLRLAEGAASRRRPRGRAKASSTRCGRSSIAAWTSARSPACAR